MERMKKILNRIYDFRYYICILILIICAMFNISGSSVAVWKDYVNYGQDSGTILGQAKAIRSDEWAVYLPLLESQVQGDNHFPYISNIVGSDSTDMFIVYGQPVLDISMIFRIFHLGYLIFGIDRGLSIFWVARILVLFLVSLEFMLIMTKKNKLLALTATIMITFAPAVQWWFAINGLVEMLIFGQLSILMLIKYMNDTSYIKRLIYLIVIAISAGSYILTFYPAWEVPFAYIILALIIWVIKENYKNCKIRKNDILMIVIVGILFAILMGHICIESKDAIKVIMNTDYPGERVETGGGMLKEYFKSAMTIFFPFRETGLENNVCSESIFFDAFPIGLILSLIVIFKEKNKDFLLIVLLILSLFLGIYCIIGFPQIIAKITLMSFSISKRAIVATSFINLLIFIRSLALIKESNIKIKKSIIISIVLALCITFLCKYTYYAYITKLIMILMFVILSLVFYFSLRFKEKYNYYILLIILTLISLVSGITVNPIQSGTQVIYNTPLATEIQKINNEDKENWMVEGVGLPMINYPIMMGAKTINCTNVYPHLNLWEKLDPNGQYKEIYNRYAHIAIQITSNENKFELIRKDVFNLYITADKLELMDVKYILTSNDLEKYNTNTVEFNKKYEDNLNYKIYEVDYIK